MTDRFTIATLSEVLAVARDGEQGFQTCADCARDPTLAAVLGAQARRYELAGAELMELITQSGADPRIRVRFLCAARRGWIHLRTSVALDEDRALVNECERSEDHALEVYRNALDDPLPEFVRAAIQRQFESLMDSKQWIRNLRDDTPHGALVVASAGGQLRQ